MPFDNSIISYGMTQPPVFLAVTAHQAPTEWELDYLPGIIYSKHFDNFFFFTKMSMCFANFNFSLRLKAFLLPFIKCNKPIKENCFFFLFVNCSSHTASSFAFR